MKNPNSTRQYLLIIGLTVLVCTLVYFLFRKTKSEPDETLEQRIEELNGRVIGLEQENDENNQILYQLARENDSLVAVTRQIQQVQILVKHKYDEVPNRINALDKSELRRELTNY